MIKSFIVGSLLFVSLSANAGFISGYIVGSTTTGSAPKSDQPTVIFSDSHDILTCCRHSNTSINACGVNSYRDSTGVFRSDISPERYAKNNGYSKLHRVGFMPRDRGCDMLILEVSK